MVWDDRACSVFQRSETSGQKHVHNPNYSSLISFTCASICCLRGMALESAGRRPDIRKSQLYVASAPLCPPHFKEFLKRLILAKCSGLRPLEVRSSSNGPKLGRLTVFIRTTSMPKYTSNVLCCFEVRAGSLTGFVGPDYMSMLLRANFEFNCFLD